MRILLLVLGVIAVAGVIQSQVSQSLVSLSTNAETFNAGDEFTVTIAVQDAQGVYGSSLKLEYDPAALAVVPQENNTAIVPGAFFADRPGFPLRNAVDDTTGTIEYALTLRQPAEPVTDSGVLGTIQMRALRDGPASINLTEARLLSPQFEEVNGRTIARQIDEIPVAVQNITLNVGGGDVVVNSPEVLATQPVPDVAVAPANNPQNQIELSIVLDSRLPVAVIGFSFLTIGLLLFMISLVAYINLRRQYSFEDGF